LESARFPLPTAHHRQAAILLFFLALIVPAFSLQAEDKKEERIRTEIPYRDGTVIMLSDTQEVISKTLYHAKGHVRITYQDFDVTGEEAEYDKETGRGYISGNTRFVQKQQWLTCSRAEFNFAVQTGVFYEASGYLDRQFLISGHKILKTGPDTYQIEEGLVTACQEKRPKWRFRASSMDIEVDNTARMHNTIFEIKGIPVIYFPYVVMPMEKRLRSSGFMPFHTGSSTTKGREFSDGYYQTLGRSADATVYADYFSLRGLAVGGIFRARPNPTTRLYLQAYGIEDKLNQGGVELNVDGESQLPDDWRAVARVNITSNFTFQQAFADSFTAATVPQQLASAFLTRDHDSFSTNIAFERDDVVFPTRDLVVKKIPSLEFLSLGMPLGNSPFVLSFQTSLDGMSRTDSTMQTQLVQRLDFYPHLMLRLPSFEGFSLIPSFGVRETYYGAQLSDDPSAGTVNRALHRRYADFSLELKTPVLERDFASSWFGEMQNTVEPFVTYRWIHGIDDFSNIIRFDEQDAIADTNELEYGIMSRFFRNRSIGGGNSENQEFMSFGLIQKYYFDPTFGGAFEPGQSNSFYPLDTVTGFYQTSTLSNLAPISAVFQLSPQNATHNDFRADFDPTLQRWRNESLATVWLLKNFYISGTFFRQAPEAGIAASNTLQGQFRYGLPDRGLGSSFTLSYNLKTGQLLNSNTRVNYTWDCCGVALEFNQYDLGVRVESKFSFSFMLKGIGNFGNLKRPQSLF